MVKDRSESVCDGVFCIVFRKLKRTLAFTKTPYLNWILSLNETNLRVYVKTVGQWHFTNMT